MEKKLKILVVEDNCEEHTNLIDCINSYEDFILVGETDSAQIAVEIIKKHLPDVVILKLELYDEKGVRLEVVKKINESYINKYPYILTITSNPSRIFHKTLYQLGVDFILLKNQDTYSAQYIIYHINFIKNNIINMPKISAAYMDSNESSEHYHKRVTGIIHSELNRIGINPKHKGYKYLTDAIFLTIQNPDVNFYAPISEKYHCSHESTARAMQYSIQRAWDTSLLDDLFAHYTAKTNSGRGCPTILEFIRFYAGKIKCIC